MSHLVCSDMDQRILAFCPALMRFAGSDRTLSPLTDTHRACVGSTSRTDYSLKVSSESRRYTTWRLQPRVPGSRQSTSLRATRDNLDLGFRA